MEKAGRAIVSSRLLKKVLRVEPIHSRSVRDTDCLCLLHLSPAAAPILRIPQVRSGELRSLYSGVPGGEMSDVYTHVLLPGDAHELREICLKAFQKEGRLFVWPYEIKSKCIFSNWKCTADGKHRAIGIFDSTGPSRSSRSGSAMPPIWAMRSCFPEGLSKPARFIRATGGSALRKAAGIFGNSRSAG